jgi:hypothetical protein
LEFYYRPFQKGNSASCKMERKPAPQYEMKCSQPSVTELTFLRNRRLGVGGGEKGGHFGEKEGTTNVVTQWTLVTSPESCILVWVALRQLWLPRGNRALLGSAAGVSYDLRSACLCQRKSSSALLGLTESGLTESGEHSLS